MTDDPLREQARILLRTARADGHACRALAHDPQASPWIIGFHRQQAVEKCLKAVLAAPGVRYPFTHDIEALLKLVRNSDLVLPADAENLPRLTPFAALARYDDEFDPEATALRSVASDWLLARSAQVLHWAQRQTGAA